MKVKQSTKRHVPPLEDVLRLIQRITDVPEEELTPLLSAVDVWRYPRGDLHSWIPVLDRFDAILESTISTYALSKLQLTPFTQSSKDLVLAILRFLKLLLENNHSRKLFSSYDRLCDLLLTSDLEVLQAALYVLLRPSQQYGTTTPYERSLGQRIRSRLLVMARGTDLTRSVAPDLKALATTERFEIPAEAHKLSITFYPVKEEDVAPKDKEQEQEPAVKPVIAATSASTATLDVVPKMDLQKSITELASKVHMGIEDEFETQHRARWVAACSDSATRQDLLAIRMLAVAVYTFLSSEDADQSPIFLYEPNLVAQISELLVPQVAENVQGAALVALHACGHHRSKFAEVLTGLGVNLNHGLLMTLFRRVIAKLTVNEPISNEVLDGTFTLIAFIATSPNPGHALIGAGVVSCLLDVLHIKSPRRDTYIPRATGLLDALNTSTSPVISNANGVNVLVQAVKTEIDNFLAEPVPEATELLSKETIITYQTTPLKAILRSLNRLLSSGSEGSRNLVDTDLPKQLKRIFENAPPFEHRVLAQAINTMSSFVHNEPTSLSILQELHLPQTLFSVLAKSVHPSPEVLAASIGAVGACCLNTAGLEQINAEPAVLLNIVETAVKPSEPGQDFAQQLGASVDELTRHHPSLRPTILEGIMRVLDRTVTEADAFVPPQDDLKEYSYDMIEDPKTVNNDSLAAFAKVCKLLVGALSNKALCKDFIQAGGITKALYFVDTPCVPVKYTATDAYAALSKLLRVLASEEPTQLLENLIDSIQNILNNTESFWQGDATGWATIKDTEEESLKEQFKRIPGLGIRLSYLADVLLGVGWSPSKMITSYYKAFGVTEGKPFISNLATLHRACFRYHARTTAEDPLPEDPNAPPPVTPKPASRFLATRMHANLIRVFKSFVKLLFQKRLDANLRREADAMAKAIALGIKGHLEPQGTPVMMRADDHVAVGLATLLLFDERGHEGRVSPVLYIQFHAVGGVAALIQAASRIMDEMDKDHAIPEADRTEEQKKAYSQSSANVRIPLVVFSALVTPFPLVENSQSRVLVDLGEKWSAVDAMVQLRLDILPLAQRAWSSPWLSSTSIPTIKAAVRTFLITMEGKAEEPAKPAPAPVPITPVVVVPRPPVTADQTRVAQLMDMGFSRGSSEAALIRVRNNVGAAAEVLLTMPHLFPDTPSSNTAPAEETAQEEAPATEATEGAEAQANPAEASTEAPAAPTEAAGEASTSTEASAAPAEGNGQTPAEPSTSTEAPAEAAEEQPPMDVDPPAPSVPIREQLDTLRASYKEGVASRALQLLDTTEDLVFELLTAFPGGLEGATFLLNQALETVQSTSETRDKELSARLRMIAVFIRHQDVVLDAAAQKLATEVVNPLQVSSPRPTWTAALLHFVEAVFAASEKITPAKIGDEPSQPMARDSGLNDVASRVAAIAADILEDKDAQQVELLASLRVLVVISRHHRDLITPALITKLLQPFKVATVNLQGLQPYVAMILRHAFEDENVLVTAMRREIRQYLSPSRHKVTDVNHFAHQLRQSALRNPNTFLEAVDRECALNDPSPPQSVYHIRALDNEQKASTSQADPFRDHDRVSSPIMDSLVSELAKSVQEQSVYTGLIVSLLTESIGSYVVAKQMFMTSLRRHGLFPGTKNGLANFVNETVCKVDLSAATDESDSPQRSLSSWGTSLIVALCSDPGGDLKEDSEDLTNVRRSVLDVIVKAIKEPVADLNARYGRLWALSNLIHRLLSTRASASQKPSDSSVQIAKVMLEKNFVSVLTAAAGEVDLNFPGIRTVLASFLLALDHLTKVSIKWSKTGKKTEEVSSDDESESDDDVDMMSDEEPEAPDLYRNSALGMLDMMEEDSDEEDDDDDEDDDMMEAFEEDMMDELDDEGSETDDSEGDDDSLGMEGMDGLDGLDEEEPHEWSGDEMDGDEGMEEDPEVILGTGEDEGEWEDEEEGDESDAIRTDEEVAFDGFDDQEEVYDDMEMDDLVEEEDFDELLMDDIDGDLLRENVVEEAGPWGWGSTGPAGDSRRLDPEGEVAAMFGRTQQRSSPAQPALITQAAGQTRRRDISNRSDVLAALEQVGGHRAVAILEELMAQTQEAGINSFRIGVNATESGQLEITVAGRTFRIPMHGHHHGHNHGSRSGQGQSPTSPTAVENPIPDYTPRPTSQRWLEEMRLAPVQSDKFLKDFVVHLINRLIPEAKKRAEEEEKKRAEQEKKLAEEAARQAEIAAKNQKETEEKKNAAETKAKEEEASGTQESAAPGPSTAASTGQPQVIEPGQEETTQEPSEGHSVEVTELPADVDMEVEDDEGGDEDDGTLARTIVVIHGEEIDITDAGIDLEFLQALPEDMRADVIEQHLREQGRARAPPANPPDTSGISPEFLDALPPDIRAEVIMQQAMESARRATPAEQPPTAAPAIPTIATMPTGPAENFLTTLNDELRDVVLMGQTLGDFSLPRAPRNETAKKPARESIQLLEKPGIASLARLLFFPEALQKGHLFRILANVCENSTTRSDLLNLLLSVLQEGSGDLPMVDRSFQQMSIKAMTTPKSTSKAKAAESPAPASTNLFAHLQTDNIPTFIAQRCLEALTHIVNTNTQAVSFFLTEHEQGVGLKKTPGKKGKGKVLPQTKFPIIILLGLLDRPALLATNGVTESLTALLATITRPLSSLKAELQDVKEGEEKPAAEIAAKIGIGRYPSIPPAQVRVVVNLLTAGECSSRVFNQTMIVLQNLSCIPDTKEVLLQELRDRSQKLGHSLQTELESLRTELGRSNEEPSSATLATFSSPSSTQAQLLRLLKTIEYLHLNKVDPDPPGETMSEGEKAVSDVYQAFDFEPMWATLWQCLSLVESRDDTEQIALILLPLVEALMVVCKYRERIRDVRSPSVTSSGDNEDLFLSFTTHHRKVLNTIVRNNPALLSGSFSLLIHNPRVLDFDNKRQWFLQKLKRKKDQMVPSGALHLNVRRQYVFEDSFRALGQRTGDEIKYGKLSVKFYNEDGVDAGGVSREWYSVLAQQIFDPNFALFEPCAADQQTYQPNKMSAVNEQHLGYFKFVGRVIGKAVYDSRLLDAYFSRAFYKQILGRTVDMRDLESIDPEYHKSLQWMLENDITGVIDQEFTIEDDQFGETKVVELKPGGASIPVTEENKEEYVRLVVSYRLDNSIKTQIKAFLEGFYEIIPRNLIQIFEPDQLELLISGITTIDIDELKNATQMSGWKSGDPEIGWFWRALRSFSQEERSRFLMFVTSSSRVPLGGFSQLQGSSGTQPFQIQKLYAEQGSLPQASTCFNLLLLPTYSSYEHLREKLLFAVTETGGFGKA